MTKDPHDDMTELESATHYLKEAQTLYNLEEGVESLNEDAALKMVDKALSELQKFLESEMNVVVEEDLSDE